MDIMSKEAAALDPRRIVPAHPADFQAVHNLRRVGPDRILTELDALLPWTQDGHRAVARGVGEVLAGHYTAIRPQLLQILRGPDTPWKGAFLTLVVGPVLQAHPDAEIVQELRRLAPPESAEQAWQLLQELGL